MRKRTACIEGHACPRSGQFGTHFLIILDFQIPFMFKSKYFVLLWNIAFAFSLQRTQTVGCVDWYVVTATLDNSGDVMCGAAGLVPKTPV